MPKFRVKTPIRKDAKPDDNPGPTHFPGDIIELSKKEADAMGSDVLQPINEPKAEKNGTGADN